MAEILFPKPDAMMAAFEDFRQLMTLVRKATSRFPGFPKAQEVTTIQAPTIQAPVAEVFTTQTSVTKSSDTRFCPVTQAVVTKGPITRAPVIFTFPARSSSADTPFTQTSISRPPVFYQPSIYQLRPYQAHDLQASFHRSAIPQILDAQTTVSQAHTIEVSVNEALDIPSGVFRATRSQRNRYQIPFAPLFAPQAALPMNQKKKKNRAKKRKPKAQIPIVQAPTARATVSVGQQKKEQGKSIQIPSARCPTKPAVPSMNQDRSKTENASKNNNLVDAAKDPSIIRRTLQRMVDNLRVNESTINPANLAEQLEVLSNLEQRCKLGAFSTLPLVGPLDFPSFMRHRFRIAILKIQQETEQESKQESKRAYKQAVRQRKLRKAKLIQPSASSGGVSMQDQSQTFARIVTPALALASQPILSAARLEYMTAKCANRGIEGSENASSFEGTSAHMIVSLNGDEDVEMAILSESDAEEWLKIQ